MTDGNRHLLLLSGGRVAEEFAELCGQRSFSHCREPYAALEELARGGYDALVVAEGYSDVGGLARAVRRLGRSTRTLLLCSPAGEAELRSAEYEAIEDYFIYPPSPADLERIFGAGPAPARIEVPPTAAAVEISANEIAALMESAYSVDGLSEHVLQLVGRWSGAQLRWADAAGDPEGEPLLLLDADPPRMLLCDNQLGISPQAHRKLESLQLLLGPLAAQVRRTEALHRLAITDHLTGAYNRRYFYHLTDQLLAKARADRTRVTLLLYDIDDFKRYNDTYGHAAGDEVLRETVGLMQRTTRTRDVVARIGGDEFAVLFWDAEPRRRPDSQHPESAFALANRFAEAVAKHEFPSLGPEAKGVLTISGGLATYPWDGRTCRELLRHADGGLRQAKQAGKNVIRIVGDRQP